MCRTNSKSRFLFAFGLGVITASFFESGFALFMVGISLIILSFALKSDC